MYGPARRRFRAGGGAKLQESSRLQSRTALDKFDPQITLCHCLGPKLPIPECLFTSVELTMQSRTGRVVEGLTFMSACSANQTWRKERPHRGRRPPSGLLMYTSGTPDYASVHVALCRLSLLFGKCDYAISCGPFTFFGSRVGPALTSHYHWLAPQNETRV